MSSLSAEPTPAAQHDVGLTLVEVAIDQRDATLALSKATIKAACITAAATLVATQLRDKSAVMSDTAADVAWLAEMIRSSIGEARS